jgi:hypothetical protein
VSSVALGYWIASGSILSDSSVFKMAAGAGQTPLLTLGASSQEEPREIRIFSAEFGTDD